jgi:ankyrin repeat protein
MLCAKMIQHLLTVFESPIAYFFFSSASENRGDPFIVIRSWISQIISHERDAFRIACEKWEEQDKRIATRTDILEIFSAIARQVPSCTFIVDGLDECTWAGESWKAYDDSLTTEFVEAIQRATTHTATRIMIVSRNEPEIREAYNSIRANGELQTLVEYQISPQDVRPDAMSFSRSIVDKRLPNKVESQKEVLSQRMVNRCDGMFLWMRMLGDQLRGGLNRRKLEEIVDQAPTAIERLYDRNWNRISDLSENDSSRALSILRWAAFALRPLTILEITDALLIIDDDNCEDLLVNELPDAIDEEYIKSEILGLCGSLLETRRGTANQDLGCMTIHLSHFSVKQYILRKMPARDGRLLANEQLRLSNDAAQNNILAKLCLRYLSYQRIWPQPVQTDDRPATRPFLDYAAGSWNEHLKTTGSNYPNVAALIRILFDPANPTWELWRRWFDLNGCDPKATEEPEDNPPASPLFYASLLGLDDTVRSLSENRKSDVNHIDGRNRTAVQAACSMGHLTSIRTLLACGADVAIANNGGWTPLNLAANSGHIEVIKVLLEKSADISVANNNRWTPLNTASDSGHIEVVKLLLEKGADISVANSGGWTPLNSASNKGHIEIVKLLLEKGADTSLATSDGWTPLNSASTNGYIEAVKLLLEKGADISVATSDGWTPLNSASTNGHIEIVKLLLEKGADISVATSSGWTPLNLASNKGHIEVVKLLLEKGADISVATSSGWTSLNLASNRGHIEIVKLLLEKGADISVATSSGWTPLNSASTNGHIEIVKLLLEKGADISVATSSGWTPLNSASTNGYIEIVKLLLEKGADTSVTTSGGWTSLNVASYRGHIEIVKLLLEKGADISVATSSGCTPLNSASANGHIEVVKLLLEKSAVADEKDIKHGQTALTSATRPGHQAIAELLPTDYAADLNSTDTAGRTPLSAAALNGQKEMVMALLTSYGVYPDPKDHYGSTPLSLASRNCHAEVVKALLATGSVEVDCQDCYGRTPLWWARRSGTADIEQLLLEYAEERGISLSDTDTPMRTGSTRYSFMSRSCDICTLGIPEDIIRYECGICNMGDFDVCSDCYDDGGRCLKVDHELVPKKTTDESS